MSLNTKVLTQFISKENFDYLNGLIDMTRYDLERFISNNMNHIDIRLDMWANVRKLNRLFLKLHADEREESVKDKIIKRFMARENVQYLLKMTKLPERELLSRMFTFSSNDALDLIENYDQTVMAPRDLDNLKPKKADISSMFAEINRVFLQPYGNSKSFESYQDSQLMQDSLAPPGYEHLNKGPKGGFYVGPKSEENPDYDGNPVNRFWLKGEKRERVQGIPWYQHLEHNTMDRDISETLGANYTEFSNPAANRGDKAVYKKYSRAFPHK
jgi:hypothetical protein